MMINAVSNVNVNRHGRSKLRGTRDKKHSNSEEEESKNEKMCFKCGHKYPHEDEKPCPAKGGALGHFSSVKAQIVPSMLVAVEFTCRAGIQWCGLQVSCRGLGSSGSLATLTSSNVTSPTRTQRE